MSEPVTLVLRHPVELKQADGTVLERITELTLRRLRGGDVRRLMNAKDKGTGDFTQALVCAAAGIPPSTFDQLDGEDVVAAAEAAGGFLGSGPATPRT